MLNRLFLVDNVELLRNNLAAICSAVQKGVKVIPLSETAYEWLRQQEVDCVNFHIYEHKGMYDDLISTAQSFGTGWYKTGDTGKDFTIFDGISAGSLLERTMIYYFTDLLKTLLITEAVIQKEKPDKILIFTSTAESMTPYADIYTIERIVRVLANEDTIEIVKSTSKKEKTTYESSYLKGAIKETLSYINSIFNLIQKFVNAVTGKRRGKKIVFYEAFNHIKAVLETISKESNNTKLVHLQRSFSPSLYFKLKHSKARIEDLKRYCVKSLKRVYDIDVDGVRKNMEDFLKYRGKNIYSVSGERLKYILKRYIPDVVIPDIKTARNYFKKERPDVVITENDSSYFERLITIVAKDESIKTLVVQHGMTLGGASGMRPDLPSFDFYPLVADRFLAYGEYTKNWFIQKGTDPKKIIVTGASRYDVYYNGNTKKYPDNTKYDITGGRNRLTLFILSEITHRQYIPTFHHNIYSVKQQVRSIAGMARMMNDTYFIIRPHSLDKELVGLLQKEADSISPHNVLVDRSMSLEKLLRIADICVGAHSSALVEAMICSIPVITFSHPDTKADIASFDDYGLCIHLDSFDELQDTLKRLLDNESDFKRNRDKMIRNIHLVNYNHDGNATNRIAGYILQS